MALGLVICNLLAQDRCHEGRLPPWYAPLLGGLVSGAIAVLVIQKVMPTGTSAWPETMQAFHDATPNGKPLWIWVMAYSLGMQLTYMLRWHRHVDSLHCFELVVFMGWIIGLGRILSLDAGHDLPSAVILSIGTSLPFALLWTLIMMILDPHWSEKRWKRLNKRLIAKVKAHKAQQLSEQAEAIRHAQQPAETESETEQPDTSPLPLDP